MYKKLLISFLSLFLFHLFLACGTSQNKGTEQQWTNPIREGINQYGMKDFFVFYEEENYYLLGTEYDNPFKRYLGPNIYKSKDLISHPLVKRHIL